MHDGLAASLRRDRDVLERLAVDAGDCLGVERRSISVGHVVIRLQFVGRRLANRLWPALSHLVGTEEIDHRAHVTITLWDMSEAGQRLPDLSLVPKSNEAPRSTYVSSDKGDGAATGLIEAWLQPLESAISLFDHQQRCGWYCVRSANDLPAWESAAPLRALLRWSLACCDLHVVHAACVGHKDRAALLAGPGGSGKSTTTALCVLAGLRSVGDDYVVIDAANRRAFSLYRTLKLDRRLLAGYQPFGAFESSEAGHNKRVLWLDDLAPGCVVANLPISAVLVPRVQTGESTSFARASPGDAVRALAPSSVFQIPGRADSVTAAIAQLASGVPAYKVAFGNDLDGIADTVASFLNGLSRELAQTDAS